MLKNIAAKDIGPLWDRIRTGLVEVKKETTDDWLPEDVYMSLKNAASSLYIGEDENGEYLGFLVLRHVATFHSSKVEVWAAYSATKVPLMAMAWKELLEITANVGATKIRFSSAREEWRQVAPRLGFVQAKQVSYEFTLGEPN